MTKLETFPIQNTEIVSRILDGEAVLVMPQHGKVKVLNEVGARIWSLANGSKSLRDIINVIANEYEVSAEEAEADAIAFVDELVSREMLSLAEAAL